MVTSFGEGDRCFVVRFGCPGREDIFIRERSEKNKVLSGQCGCTTADSYRKKLQETASNMEEANDDVKKLLLSAIDSLWGHLEDAIS